MFICVHQHYGIVSNTHSKIKKRWGFDFVGDFVCLLSRDENSFLLLLKIFLNYQQSHFCYSITNWKQKITSAISFLYLFFSSFRNSSSKCGTERFSFMKTKNKQTLALLHYFKKIHKFVHKFWERYCVSRLVNIFKQNCKSIPKLDSFTVACTVTPSNMSHWYAISWKESSFRL